MTKQATETLTSWVSPRWSTAQDSERDWWDSRKADIDLTYLPDYADFLRADLKGILEINDTTRILEIGSGPAGIVAYLKSRERFGIDPLESYFTSVPEFVKMRDQGVRYLPARGEDLPFTDKRFDLVILDNVLDHCESPELVLSETSRVLRDGGVVYFRLNICSSWGKTCRDFLDRFEIDRSHPQNFTLQTTIKGFDVAGLTILRSELDGFWQEWFKNLRSGRLRNLAQAALFATRKPALWILKK